MTDAVQSVNAGNRFTRWAFRHRYEIGLFLAFFVFNAALSLLLTVPAAMPDEYGVLSAANWFADGAEWGPKPANYYGYVHSLLYSVMFVFSDDLVTIYQGALCINGIFAALVPVYCYKILTNVIGSASCVKSACISAVIGLYPFFTLYTKRSGNETLLFFITFVCVYLLGKNLMTNSKAAFRVNSLLLGVLPAVCYAAHGMGLVFPVALCLCILITRIGFKRDAVNYLLFAASLVVFFLIDAQVKDLVKEAIYLAPEDGMRNTLSFSYTRMLSAITTYEGIAVLVKMLVSRLHYLASATFCLFPLACVLVVFYIRRVLRHRRARKTMIAQGMGVAAPDTGKTAAWFAMVLFSCLTLAGAILLSSLNHITVTIERGGTYFFYGRYYEYLALPLVLFCLYWLLSEKFRKRPLLIASGATLVIYVLLTLFVKRFVSPLLITETSVTRRQTIYGTLPFLGNSYADLTVPGASGTAIEVYSLVNLGLVSMGVFCVFMLFVLYKKHAPALLLVGGMFLYATAFDMGTTVVHRSTGNYEAYRPMERLKSAFKEDQILQELYEEYPNLCVINTMDSGNNKKYRTQMGFDEYTVKRFEWNPDKEYDNYIVLCNADSEEITNNETVALVRQDSNMTAWLCGDEIIDRYYELGGAEISLAQNTEG